MQNNSKITFFFILALIFLLTSQTHAEQKLLSPEIQSSGLKTIIVQADFQDNDFYFPDDLYDDFYEEEIDYQVPDPLRPFNVAMHHFNDRLYFWVLKPAAQGWETVVPEPARRGIRNFFINLGFPVRFTNELLQLKPEKAGGELGAFLLNSTFGVLGFMNLAKELYDYDPDPQDLGLTLGYYGAGPGFFLVLPVFGPSSFRDAIGRSGDRFLKPVYYVRPWELAAAAQGTETVNSTSFRIGDYEAIKDAALDPYEAIKSGFIQRREARIRN
jgi:phospholipid-binding lipoprotein MlaA